MLYHEYGTALFYFTTNTVTGRTEIVLDEKILPASVVHGLYRLQNASVAVTNDHANHTTSRRLLFFRELVRSVEYGVKNGWSQADRLHERFVQSISLVYNYQYIPEAQQEAFVPSWPPYQTKTDGETCDELNELLNITLRIVDGMLLGLSTDRTAQLNSSNTRCCSQGRMA